VGKGAISAQHQPKGGKIEGRGPKRRLNKKNRNKGDLRGGGGGGGGRGGGGGGGWGRSMKGRKKRQSRRGVLSKRKKANMVMRARPALWGKLPNPTIEEGGVERKSNRGSVGKKKSSLALPNGRKKTCPAYRQPTEGEGKTQKGRIEGGKKNPLAHWKGQTLKKKPTPSTKKKARRKSTGKEKKNCPLNQKGKRGNPHSPLVVNWERGKEKYLRERGRGKEDWKTCFARREKRRGGELVAL